MKRYTLTIFAAMSILLCLVLGLSARSFAGAKVAPKDVKFACTHHGPANMMLTLTHEEGKARKIEIVGKNNGTKWFVTIDGTPAADGNGGKNGDKVKVHTGDEIKWIITAANHGVAFAEQDLAQDLLDFDKKASLSLVDLTKILTTDAWKAFGTKRWGTEAVDAGKDPIVMVLGKVK